jgi:hypothetical protein
MYHGHYRSLIYKCLAGLLEAGVELLRDRPWGVGWRCLSGSGRGACQHVALHCATTTHALRHLPAPVCNTPDQTTDYNFAWRRSRPSSVGWCSSNTAGWLRM